MKGVAVDPVKRIARASTGNSAEEILAATPLMALHRCWVNAAAWALASHWAAVWGGGRASTEPPATIYCRLESRSILNSVRRVLPLIPNFVRKAWASSWRVWRDG